MSKADLKKYHIFMGDVVASSTRSQVELQRQLKQLIKDANKQLSTTILSPYTITLGDEFQGISKSLRDVVETIFFFEERILQKKYTFKLHYVAHWGEIKTPINRAIAYEMMGPGLAKARATLTLKKKRRPRFIFDDDPAGSTVLNNLFYVLEGIIDRWKPRDFSLILEMIKSDSDSAIGSKLKKDRTLIWKRRETLRLNEYVRLKEALVKVAGLMEDDFERQKVKI